MCLNPCPRLLGKITRLIVAVLQTIFLNRVDVFGRLFWIILLVALSYRLRALMQGLYQAYRSFVSAGSPDLFYS